MRVRLQETPIDVQAELADFHDPACGALVVFEGRVRNHHMGKPTSYLVYEAYAPMAEKEIMKIMEEARERFGTGPLRVVHRTGTLQIGEAAVLVAALSAHRAEAFAAAAYVMDEIKHRAPVWKKEFRPDGSSEWVFCEHVHHHHAHHHGHTHGQ